MHIGYDNKGQKLDLGDICKFTINKQEKIGMITYSDTDFAYCLDMLDDSFPSIYMHKTDVGSIEKIINVWSTDVNDKTYEGFRKIAK